MRTAVASPCDCDKLSGNYTFPLTFPNRKTVHDDFNRVIAAAVEMDVFFQRKEFAIDASFDVPQTREAVEFLLVFALAPTNDGSQDHDLTSDLLFEDPDGNLLG